MFQFFGKGVGKRIFSAFLCVVLSFSNVQIAYAEEFTGEVFQEEKLRQDTFSVSDSNVQENQIKNEKTSLLILMMKKIKKRKLLRRKSRRKRVFS